MLHQRGNGITVYWIKSTHSIDSENSISREVIWVSVHHSTLVRLVLLSFPWFSCLLVHYENRFHYYLKYINENQEIRNLRYVM